MGASESGSGSPPSMGCGNNDKRPEQPPPLPPLPSTQSNPTPSTPARKRRPTPLLSPVPSFAALLRLPPSRPVTPSPLRISHFQSPPRTPTLALSPATATATSSSSLLFAVEDVMPPSVHQPKPTRPALDLSAQRTPHAAMPSRPSSRSEKLLRETLLRDTDQRPPMPPYPYPYNTASPSSRTGANPNTNTTAQSPASRHRRRHSEVPGLQRDEDEDDEVQMMRGAMLFRSPAAPPFDAPHPHHASSLARRHSHTQHHHAQTSQPSSPVLARRASVKSNTHPRAPSPATSHTRGISRSRVPPSLPLDSHHRPHHHHQHPSYPHQQQHPSYPSSTSKTTKTPSPSTLTTPNEQLLRQRLERVLQVSQQHGAQAPAHRRDVFYELDGNSSPDSPQSPSADDEYTSSLSYSSSSLEEEEGYDNDSFGHGDEEEEEESDENAVMDENGGRARMPTRGPSGAPGPNFVASPPGSSSSSSGSQNERGRLQARVRTEPNLPGMQSPKYPPHPSARRSVTAPGGVPRYNPQSPSSHSQTASQYHQHQSPHQQSPQHSRHHSSHHSQHSQHYQHYQHRSNGTTPPLVSDGSPTPPEDESSDEVEDGRLVTPPHSPYHHYSYPHSHSHSHPHPHSQSHSLSGGYAPSPYVQTKQQQLQAYGQGRKPHLAPYEEDGDDDDDDDDFSNPESEYDEGGLSTAQRRAYMAKKLPPSSYPNQLGHASQYPSQYPSTNPNHPSQLQNQHQFNVRRASAKCKTMDGYVSFAAVEGLGVPAEVDTSSDDDLKRRGGGVKGARGEGGGRGEGRGKGEGGVGGWVRRFLGSESGGVVV